MSFDFFDVAEEEEIKEELKPKKKKKKKPKEECPYCGEMFVSVARHLNYCDKNPENKEPEPSKSTVNLKESQQDIDKLREEIRGQIIENLNPTEVEQIPQLSTDEIEKIKKVIKFLGGTEGYQFIYKTITGDKIRGKMEEIIDECIEWLKKHKAYLIFKKYYEKN